MINFINIENEVPYKDRVGIPEENFGAQIALSGTPLDFQYQSDESISSFKAINYQTGEEISLSTSLISVNNGLHYCDGLINYATPLDCGIYYYLVNDKYESELFQVFEFEEVFPGENSIISISGLHFIDLTKDRPEWLKKGAPENCFAMQYVDNLNPLRFVYKSNETVTSFEIVKVDSNYEILSTISLDTSLVEIENNKHICSGNVAFDEFIPGGLYYFLVNDKYQSAVFQVFELACVVIENIVITNAIEGEIANISFDAYLTGANIASPCDLTITFSQNIDTITDSISLSPIAASFNYDFQIDAGINGFITANISNSICGKIKQYGFNVEPVDFPCLELFGGGNLELFGGGCLQIFG